MECLQFFNTPGLLPKFRREPGTVSRQAPADFANFWHPGRRNVVADQIVKENSSKEAWTGSRVVPAGLTEMLRDSVPLTMPKQINQIITVCENLIRPMPGEHAAGSQTACFLLERKTEVSSTP